MSMVRGPPSASLLQPARALSISSAARILEGARRCTLSSRYALMCCIREKVRRYLAIYTRLRWCSSCAGSYAIIIIVAKLI